MQKNPREIRLPKLVKVKGVPNKETAEKLAKKPFLLIHEIAILTGLDEILSLRIMKIAKLKPYKLMAKHLMKNVKGYDTIKVQRVLARRGRVIPGFNESFATQRQWLEILEDAVTKPLSEEWYFNPVRPDPLVDISNERSLAILDKVADLMNQEKSPAEVLKLVADAINVGSEEIDFTPHLEKVDDASVKGMKKMRKKLKKERKKTK